MQPADHQQPHEPLGVALVGLDPVLRRTLDLPRRRNHAADPGRAKRPRELEPGRSGLVGHADGSGQARAEPASSLVLPDSRRTVISPDCASTTHATVAAACTSRPTQVRTLVMVGSSNSVVGAARVQSRGNNFPDRVGGPTMIYPARRTSRSIWSRALG